MDYNDYLEMVKNLEAFRRLKPDDKVIEAIARFAYQEQITDLFGLNKLIEVFAGSLNREDVKPSDLSPSTKLTSEFLIDQIMPWVEGVRLELFKSKAAPLSTFEEAHEWLKREQEGFRQQYGVETQTKTKSKPVRKAPKEKYPFLEYSLRQKPSLYPPYLACMYRASEIAYATGFDTLSIAYYILAGIRPTLRRVETYSTEEIHRLPSGDSLVNRLVTIEIRGEISFEEQHILYQDIRQELRIKRTKAFSEKHLELYRMVRRNGESPRKKRIVAFWKSKMEEWNEKHPNEQYTTWKGLKIAYERNCKKLGKLYLKGGKVK
jgi:hypothetical protein